MNGRRALVLRWSATAVVVIALGASTFAFAQHGRGSKPGAAATAAPDVAMRAPDPPAIRSSDQFVLTLRYEAGKASVERVRRVHLAQPRVTPRNTGRFAVELLSGRTLVERVRFDFPLLGADELAGQPRQYNAPPRFENRAVVSYEVMVPDSPRISRARLVDRATLRTTPIPWPPQTESDAGAALDGAVREGGAAVDAAEAGAEGGQREAAVPLRDARAPWPDASPL